MTSSAAETYDNLVLHKPRLVLWVLLAILVFFGYHTTDFKLDASADSLLLEDDADLKLFRKIHQRYQTNDLLVVTYTPKKDLFSDEALDSLKILREELKKVSSVDTVFTILDAPLFKSSDLPLAELVNDIPNLEKPGTDRARAKVELLNSPIFRELIISADGKTTALLLGLVEEKRYNKLLQSRNELRSKKKSTGLSDKEAETLDRINIEYDQAHDALSEQRHLSVGHVRDIIKPYSKYGVLHLGGVPMITDDMVTFVRNDLIVFGGGVFVFLVIVLTVIFREFRWIVLPLLSCGYAGLIMMGVLGFAGWKVTVISSNFLALMLIITISMNIHLIVRYRQLSRDFPHKEQAELVQTTTHKMILPCLYTALTTIIGFGSLVVSGIKPVIDFGWMMSAGLAVTFVVSFLLFPSLLMVLGKKIGAKPFVENERFLLPIYLARLTETRGNMILGTAVVLTVVSLVGIFMLRVENSFINYFSEDTEIYQGLKLIDEKLGGTTPVEILIKFEDAYALKPEDLEGLSEEDKQMELEYAAERAKSPRYWFTTDKVQRIKKVHDYLDGRTEIGKVLSLASTVRIAEASAKEELDGMLLAILYTKIPAEVKKSLIDPYVSIANNEARIFARVLDSQPDLRRKELLETIRHDLVNKLGLKEQDVTVTGLLVLYNNMLQSLFQSQIKTIGVVMLGIAIMFLILFRSFTLAAIGILPNLLGAAVVLGAMGLAKVPLDMMTITIAAITIGIAVDNGIHYIYRFREEYALNNNYVESLHICHANIGKAVFYTTMTIIVGFSILVFSNFIPTIYFGLLTAAAMFIALVAALTVLPKLILQWKPFGGAGLRADSGLAYESGSASAAGAAGAGFTADAAASAVSTGSTYAAGSAYDAASKPDTGATHDDVSKGDGDLADIAPATDDAASKDETDAADGTKITDDATSKDETDDAAEGAEVTDAAASKDETDDAADSTEITDDAVSKDETDDAADSTEITDDAASKDETDDAADGTEITDDAASKDETDAADVVDVTNDEALKKETRSVDETATKDEGGSHEEAGSPDDAGSKRIA